MNAVVLHHCTAVLVQPLDRSHGGLDVQGLDILPMLLEQGDQEVHGQVNVLDQLFVGHVDIADGHRQTQDLLHLELDGGLEVVDLVSQVISVGHQARELASLKQTRFKYFLNTRGCGGGQ